MTASRADIEGSLWNPASLAGLGGSAVYLMGGHDFAASSRVLGGVLALGEARLARQVVLGGLDVGEDLGGPDEDLLRHARQLGDVDAVGMVRWAVHHPVKKED